MKALTEFPTHVLVKGIQAKTALAAEGKTPEEIQTSIGETFKYEGDKLKYFMNSLEVAGTNMEKLTHVRVLSLGEGESVPPKASKVDEQYYVPYFAMPPGKPMTQKVAVGGNKGKGKGGRDDKRGGGRGGPGGRDNKGPRADAAPGAAAPAGAKKEAAPAADTKPQA